MSALNFGNTPALTNPYALPSGVLLPQSRVRTAQPSFGASLMSGFSPASGMDSITGLASILMQTIMMMLKSAMTPQLTTNDAPVFAAPPPSSASPSPSDSSGDGGTTTGGSSNDNGTNDFTNFKQGQTGDCAVLSAITSVANDKDGQQILEKSVTKNSDGSYDVKFAGDPNDSYHVSASDMQNDKLSSGNDKVRALEVAVKQHQEQNGKQFEGSGGHDMIQLLTGKSTVNLKDQTQDPAQLKQKLMDLAKKDGDGLTLEIGASKLNGESFGGMHGLTVTNIDSNTGTVTYENPWDSGAKKTMSMDQFVSDMTASDAGGIDYTEV